MLGRRFVVESQRCFERLDRRFLLVAASCLRRRWKELQVSTCSNQERRKGERRKARTWNERRSGTLSPLLVSKLLVNLELLLLKTVRTDSKKVWEHVDVDGRLSSIPEGLRGSLEEERRGNENQFRAKTRTKEGKTHLSMPSSSVERNGESLVDVEDGLVLSCLLDDGAGEIEVAGDDGGDGFG